MRLRAIPRETGLVLVLLGPASSGLLDELGELPEFASRWSAHGVILKHRGSKRLMHTEVGELRIAYETLVLPDDGEQQLIAWLPADEPTAASLEAARSGSVPISPPRLRVVGAE